jgi:hypothetical protein
MLTAKSAPTAHFRASLASASFRFLPDGAEAHRQQQSASTAATFDVLQLEQRPLAQSIVFLDLINKGYMHDSCDVVARALARHIGERFAASGRCKHVFVHPTALRFFRSMIHQGIKFHSSAATRFKGPKNVNVSVFLPASLNIRLASLDFFVEATSVAVWNKANDDPCNCHGAHDARRASCMPTLGMTMRKEVSHLTYEAASIVWKSHEAAPYRIDGLTGLRVLRNPAHEPHNAGTYDFVQARRVLEPVALCPIYGVAGVADVDAMGAGDVLVMRLL